jgi:NADP-dependent 3-hydroxy acid dehydrogenase YdfG
MLRGRNFRTRCARTDTEGTQPTRTGNTRVIAQQIRRTLRADSFEIEPASAYPEDYEATVGQAQRESDSSYQPPLAAAVANISGYEVVFLGFPIWGETIPPVIRSFLAQHDLTGKPLVPFITHGGYGQGRSTGASSGLGEATARRLAKDGAKLVLGARRINRLQGLARDLHLADDAAVKVDVTRVGEVHDLINHAVKMHGRIDVLLNNAGLMPHSPLERLKIEDWRRMIDVNIKGVLYGIAAALPHMKAQKSGHIINVSSVAGHLVRSGGVVYAATKHAVRVISEGLRQEVKPYNIRSTTISPGAVATELTESIIEPDVAKNIGDFYAQYALPADAFANIVAFAISQPPDVDINEILFRPTRQEL